MTWIYKEARCFLRLNIGLLPGGLGINLSLKNSFGASLGKSLVSFFHYQQYIERSGDMM